MPKTESIETKPTAQTPVHRKLGRGLKSLLSSPVSVVPPTAAPPANSQHSQQPASKSLSPAGAPAQPAELPASTIAQQPAATAANSEDSIDIAWLKLDQVVPNPRQPRQQFDEIALQALAASIASSGLMQPIVVRPRPAAAGALGYELIAGERRWRAAGLAGLPTIPAIVRAVDDRTSSELSLIENLQREDLNPMERAEAFARLVEEFNLTHQELAERIGIDRSSVTNHLRLNELDEATKLAVRSGGLTMGHAKALLAVANLSRRGDLSVQALRSGWSVRELERRCKQAAGSQESQLASPAKTDVRATASLRHMHELQQKLSDHLGTKVHIHPGRTKGAGKLVIEFYTIDQFEGIMRRMEFQAG